MSKQLTNNITILQRRLTELKDIIGFKELSKGKIKFIDVYLRIIEEYIDKSLDVLDNNKFREMLKELDDN